MKQLSVRPLLFLVSLFFVVFGMFSCQKEKSVELNGQTPGTGGGSGGGGGTTGGTATFSLKSSPAHCASMIINGGFEEGLEIGGSSTLTVIVEVTKAGSWTYTTSEVNGFKFAGAGDFTTTGDHDITLYAVGKPTKAGNFIFNIKIGTGTCPLTVVVIKPGSGSGTGEYYYKATIGGVNYFQDVTENNGYVAGSGGGGGNTEFVFTGMINWDGDHLPLGKTAFGVSKGEFLNYQNITKEQFYAYFAPGDYPYTKDYNPGHGIQIGWTDPQGVYWATELGSGDQTGSTFKIISTEDANDALGRLYLQSKIQFSCKLYNEAGAVKTLTNGEALIVFGAL